MEGQGRMRMETEDERLELFRRRAVQHDGKRPLYRVVEDHIRDLINSGELIPGDLIPSEPQLARTLGVSQGTVKKAIDNLVWEGLLYRHQGKGTYISKVDFGKSLFRFFTYGDARGRAVRIHKETTARRRCAGPANVTRRLQVPDGTELIYIERLGLIGDAPILVEYSWWPAELVPGLEDEALHIPDYLYALVLDQFGVPVLRAEETLTADAADAHTARALNIPEKTPVVVLKRTTFTRGDRIVEVRTTKGRADRFSYKTEIR
ncbi:GntR family transcriptional regulator [Spiribacter halobius]|uniref:Transcriptional regulator n=1 Tax=Sediminicurvatus halobius TaxID=2182432 RepID=A0A2U2N5T0_9GAMM|nr:GntR family transcriptional regulator [Spiribacter halobius]PWG64575.1 transcriptional regulator [Spiribacter halobius]UEX79105.1 GntR family transcriptional regulator [Spiribacter halobius]